MLKSFLKIAVRTILREKVFSFINILGLSIGIGVSLLILLYSYQEFQYDKFHSNSENIHRLGIEMSFGSRSGKINGSHPPLADAMKENIPAVKNATRIFKTDGVTLKTGENSFKENQIFYADPSFFEVFDFNMLAGDSEKLAEKKTIIISADLSEKYFPSVEHSGVVGKDLLVNGTEYQVIGIIENSPIRSHIQYNALIGLVNTNFYYDDSWNSFNVSTYALLQDKSKADNFIEEVNSLMVSKVPNFEERKKNGLNMVYFQQALEDIHLNSELENEFQINGNRFYIMIFLVIGFAILLLACINFVNLSTAKSLRRAQEVGIRKVMGTSRSNLLQQFLIESLLITTLASFIGLVLAELIRIPFSSYLGIDINLSLLAEPIPFALFILSILCVSLFSGIYPAFMLSKFNPNEVLKGKSSKFVPGSNRLKSALIVLQFSVSTALMTSTIIVWNQIDYMQSMNLGMNKENVLTLPNTNTLPGRDGFIETIKSYPEVKSVSIAVNKPFSNHGGTIVMNKLNPESAHPVNFNQVDDNYIPTLEINLAEGRNFDRNRASDSLSIILNKTAAGLIFANVAIGQELIFDKNGPAYTVIGIIEDYHFESVKNNVTPMALVRSKRGNELLIRMNGDNYFNTISKLESEWKSRNPDVPFTYSFLDEDFDKLFQNENQVRAQIAFYCILAIIISILGLLGLSAYMVEKRKSELGIRKTLGAKTTDLIIMLSNNYTRLIITAILFSAPIAYFGMSRWLEDFAYRIEIGVLPFIFTGLFTLVFAYVIVSLQVYNASKSNPIQTIREN